MAFSEYADHDALGLAELVRRGEVSARELVDECIARIERVNPRLNAIITPMYESARSTADGAPASGPFAGVPFLIKDLVASVEGVRFTRGSRFYADEVGDHDSELIRRYRAAGLVLVAKTNTPELGLKPVTEPELHGPTENPWRSGLTAGGSSGGAGAAVAARVVPMAHGGDGGGSIRIPAACCGVFGLKPTRARTPAGPDFSEGWFGFALEHALTRSVRDSAALLDATSADYAGAPYAAPAQKGPYLDEVARDPGKLRVALCRKPLLPADPDPAVLRAVDDAAALMSELGHEVEEAEPQIDADRFALDFTTLVSVATAVDIDEGSELCRRRATHRDYEITTWMTAMVGRTVDAVTLEAARRRLQALSRDTARFFERYDVLLTPTLGTPPRAHHSLDPPKLLMKIEEVVAATGLKAVLRLPGLVSTIAKSIYAFIPWTPLANVTGQPSMSVPLFWDEGLPIGVMFTGRFGDEATLFRLAAQLEQARPWKDRVPPIHA